MKKHNAVKVVLVTMLVFMVLSWILPAAYYSESFVDQGRVQMGLFDLFNYPITSLSYFGYIVMFIVFVGGFYGVLYKIPAYRTFLDKIVAKCAGKEMVITFAIMIIMAFATSICGLQFGLALFIPFIVSLILLMGYDKIVAALTVVGSITVGLAGTTYAYNNITVLISSLSLNLDYQLGVRFMILAVGLILLMLNTYFYIVRSLSKKNDEIKVEKKTVKKVDTKEEKIEEKVSDTTKKNNSSKTSKSSSSSKNTKAAKTNNSGKGSKSKKTTKSGKNANKAAAKGDDIIVIKESDSDNSGLVPTIVDSSHKIWPFVVTFLLLFVILILAFITWGDYGFKINFFKDLTTDLKAFELFGFAIFAKLLGTFSEFGLWTVTDLIFVIGFAILLLSLIYKVKLDDVIDGFVSGAKKAMAPAVVIILVYSCLVITTYHPFQLTIYKAILGLGDGFNIATTTLVVILSSVFNADPSYVFQSILPYYTSVVTNADNYHIVGIMAQALYGFTMLVAPTSAVLMGVLSFLNVSYKEWLKNTWKLIVELLVVLLIIFIILALI